MDVVGVEVEREVGVFNYVPRTTDFASPWSEKFLPREGAYGVGNELVVLGTCLTL